MFKIESFITPYILAYLDKYIKNFNPADFQVSLWGGGAAFTNLNLNLEVLDEEFNLPVSFVSGHIHELRITVPWTKLTYEPIVVNVNTIEISLKLKSLCKDDVQNEAAKPSSSKELLVVSKDPNVPTSYLQSLLNKLFTNVRFQFENVIVKYVEEDIVLSLNIMKACMFTVDGNWKGAFVDLIAPDFILRKKVDVSDLTICLDKCNSAGKIDAYQEPLLYKCSFNVRIMQKFRSPQSKKAHFTRTDVLIDKMEFSVTNEQVPMLMRLYTLMVSLSRVDLKTLSLNHPKWISPKAVIGSDISMSSPVNTSTTRDTEVQIENVGVENEEEGGMFNWASWAMNSMSSVMFGDYEEEEESLPVDELESANFVSHIAFFVNKTTVTFKAFERVYDKSGCDRRTIKVRFLPFLKWRLQGIMCEWISQQNESNYHFSLCEMGVEGIGFCPCGIVDCTDNEKEQNPKIRDRNIYFTMGRQNAKYMKGSLFNDVSEKTAEEPEQKPDEEENNGSEWCLNDIIELMKQGEHAFAMEYTSVVKEPKFDKTTEELSDPDGAFTDVDVSADQLRQRIVFGPMLMIINSGLIHRLKMIHYAVKIYNYEPYDHVHNYFSSKILSTQEPNFKYLHNFHSAVDVYEMTFIKPVIEIYASDHPDYDSNSRNRHTLRRRRMTTTTPLSFVVDNWPKILISIGEIKMTLNDPGFKFKAVVEKAGKNTPRTVLDKFKRTTETTVSNVEASLNVGGQFWKIFEEFSIVYNEEYIMRADLPRDKSLKHSWKWGVKSDRVSIRLSLAQLMLLKILYLSYYNESLSEHLTVSTILEDQSYEIPVANILFSGLQYSNVIAPLTTTKKFSIGNLSIAIEKSNVPKPIPLLIGCPTSNEDMIAVIIQHCTEKSEKLTEGSAKFEDVPTTPIFLADISQFKMQYSEPLIDFLRYKAKQQHTTVPLSVRMSKEVMPPMTPLSRSETGSKISMGASGGYVPSSAASIDATSLSGTDFQALFKSKTSSRVTESHGSSFNYIPEKMRQSLSNLEVETTDDQQNEKGEEVLSFERWIVTYLAEMKNTLTIINVGGVELWFSLTRKIFNFTDDIKTVDGVVLSLAKMSIQPRAIRQWIPITEHKLPIVVPPDIKGRDLYPVMISLENMCFCTVEKGIRYDCSAPLSVLATFSLTQKLAEGKSPIIASYLHCDISLYKFTFTLPQISTIRKLLQKILHSLLSFAKENGSFASVASLPTLATHNITFESQENLNSAASDTSVCVESIISHSKGQASSLKRHSITPSPPVGSKRTCTDEDEPLPPQGAEAAPVENLETKATLWLQITLTQLQVVVFNSCSERDSASNHKLVLEINDVLSSVDFQSVFVKWNLKVTNMSLRCYKRNGHEWDFGECLGVIISSGDDITRAIHVVQCPKAMNNTVISTSGSSSPVPNLPTTNNASKIRGILVMTFTSVFSNNFHKKADVPSPVSRWISTVDKYQDKNYDDYMPFENADDRCLHEIDIILRSMDFVICPAILKPFERILQEIRAFQLPNDILTVPDEIDVCSIPYLNNNSMPLVYLQTECLRIFLKSEQDYNSRNAPNGALIQFSINLQSQSENALHRTKIRPNLYSMAERARILNIPGSPVEDRQYQIDFHNFSISTCKWKDLEDCSRRMLHKRPSAILVTQGENPALDWNNMLGEFNLDEVEAQPLLNRMEICLNFAPAIVYERCPGHPCKSLVVAGYSAELNFTNDTSVYLNLKQLRFIENFIHDATHLAEQCGMTLESTASETNDLSQDDGESGKSSLQFQSVTQTGLVNTTIHSIPVGPGENPSQSVEASLTHSEVNTIPVTNSVILDIEEECLPVGEASSTVNFDSNILKPEDSIRKSFCADSTIYRHRHMTDKVPFDLLITGSALRVTIYDINCKGENDMSVTPISYAFVGQPHLTLSTVASRHRAEASIFELCLNMAEPVNRKVKKSTIPEPSEFNLKLFESILGERNPKTGMVAPLVTLSINEIYEKRFRVSLDVTRPLRLVINRSRIQNVSRFMEIFQLKMDQSVQRNTVKSTDNRVNTLRNFVTELESLSVNFNQLVFCTLEERFKLPSASVTVSWSSAEFNIFGAGQHKKLSKDKLALKSNGNCHLNLLTISTTIGDRTDVLVNPFNVGIEVLCRWKDWSDEPYCIVSGSIDPVTINFGTNNILAFLQVYQGLQKYLQDWSTTKSDLTISEGESENTSTAFTVDVFKDDLRAGAFHYKNSLRSTDFPLVYEIVFCEPHQTVTWRYPQPRALICIEASQVPLDTAQFANVKEKKIECVVEYWDECMKVFCFYGVFYISEDEKGQVIIPHKDKLHAYVSTMWRTRIIGHFDDTDDQYLVKPELLAACLKVDSIYEPAFLPKLKANIEIQRIFVNLMNHLYYSGKAGDERLRQYTMGGLTFYDQPFATVEMTLSSLTIGSWINQSSISYGGYLKIDVVDYAYLTNTTVFYPAKIQMNALFHSTPNSNTINSEMYIFTTDVDFILGASSAHTLMYSLATWSQVLQNYKGKKVDFTDFEYSKNVILSRSLLCNDICYDVAIKHEKSEKQIVIRSRECYGIILPSEQIQFKYKVGIRDVDWKWSCAFDCAKIGISVVTIPNKGSLFVNVSTFSPSQKLITISGCFTVGNILDQSVEVALFSRHNSTEVKWIVQSRGHGPSQMIDIKDIEHLRFRFVPIASSSHPWSGIVTVKDLKDSSNSTVGLQLYKEEIGTLQIYNIWCTLIEEMHGDIPKYLIVVCPFFRMRSCVSFDTIAHISSPKKETESTFVLPGKCVDMQVDFLGEFSAPHHLTFKTSPHLQSSTPSISLVPGGASFKTPSNVRSIDDILKEIMGLNSSTEQPVPESALKWPYINEEIDLNDWVASIHNEKEIEVVVGSEPWLEGLPTVLLEAKPWALFINICGSELLICDVEVDKISSIPSYCAFSPKKFSSTFKIGVPSPNGIFWSLSLDFTEQKFRTDIHHVNINSKIPLDCFSRLEIHGKKEIFYLTLQAKIHRGIIVLALRSTFSINNASNTKLLVHGVSLVQSKTQNPEDWSTITKYSSLKPVCGHEKEKRNFRPLLTFSCNCDDYIVGNNGLKYLALSCGGPWWFIQLMKFELIFDNMSANIGFPAKRMAFALPKYGGILNHEETEEMRMATEPLVLSWMSKNGQIWISLKPDTSPQLMLSNMTNVDLVYARASEITNIPCEETEHFEQYLLLPKNTTGHYTFQSSNSKFPDLNAGIKEILPLLIVAKVTPEKLPSIKMAQTEKDQNPIVNNAIMALNSEISQEKESVGKLGTLIFSELLEWSKEIRIDGENISQQYYRLSDATDVKVLVERLGQSYFIYIENTSSIEVSAKDIRGRIMSNVANDRDSILQGSPSSETPDNILQVPTTQKMDLSLFTVNSTEEMNSTNGLSPKRNAFAELEDTVSVISRSWECMAFFPEVRLLITDDLSNPVRKSELLSFTFQDILLEQKTYSDRNLLRTLNNVSKEMSVVNLKIGDFQVDSPSLGDKKCDFSVILKQESEYKELPKFESPSIDFLPYFLTAQRAGGRFMIQANFHLASNSTSDKVLEEIFLKILPFSVYMEDQFLENVLPSLNNIYQVVEHSLPLFSASEKLNSPSSRLIIRNTSTSVKKHSNIILDIQESQSNSLTFTTNKTSPLSQLTFPSQSDFNISVSDAEADASSQAESFYTSVNDLDNWKEILFSKSQMSKHHHLSHRAVSIGKSQPEVTPEDSSATEKDESVVLNTVEGSDENELSVEYSWLSNECICVPSEVQTVLSQFSNPIWLRKLTIEPCDMFVTFRMFRKMYLAVDHSPMQMDALHVYSLHTTSYGLGQSIAAHYFKGAVFQVKNPLRLIGSMELLGSPGSLARSVGTGLHDFVVYPYQGLFHGPTGFLSGLTHGFSSLLKNVTAGTLTSVTNWAWSVSRNIDKLTLDKDEQIFTEEGRRVEVEGFTDGLIQGFTGFGIRLLGAVGGIAHHPIQNVIERGASPSSVISGVGKGIIGVVTKPIGGAVELVAMTGQGLLRGAGWTPQLKMKHDPFVEYLDSCSSSLLKLRWRLYEDMEGDDERLLLAVDATRVTSPLKQSEMTFVSLLLTTQKLYVVALNSEDDDLISCPITKLDLDNNENFVTVRPLHSRRIDEMSLAEERIIEFVRGYWNASSSSKSDGPLTRVLGSSPPVASIFPSMAAVHSTETQDVPRGAQDSLEKANAQPNSIEDVHRKKNERLPFKKFSETDPLVCGDYMMNSIYKAEFISTFTWAKMNENDLFFRFC